MRVTANKNSIRTATRKNLALFLVLVSGFTITGCSSQTDTPQNQTDDNQSQPEESLFGPKSVNCDGILKISREPYRIITDLSGPWLETATSKDVQGVLRAKGYESFAAFQSYLQEYRDQVVMMLNEEPYYPQENLVPDLDALQAYNLWLQDEGKTGQDLSNALWMAQGGFENVGKYCSGDDITSSTIIDGELPGPSN
jgi:hypothetical protein